ncbi:hypothetical protein [Shewanella acanthi]|uniref:hypothetical protein n=1 Tax=Shewanella acanthi TaxID=2864212 RepID=UPI001C654AB7|nr:hypothetical protein [Shewanella acanthi]QYJ77436.1 hypothetical protein K0H61_09720 [Shewanella acanthi]
MKKLLVLFLLGSLTACDKDYSSEPKKDNDLTVDYLSSGFHHGVANVSGSEKTFNAFFSASGSYILAYDETGLSNIYWKSGEEWQGYRSENFSIMFNEIDRQVHALNQEHLKSLITHSEGYSGFLELDEGEFKASWSGCDAFGSMVKHFGHVKIWDLQISNCENEGSFTALTIATNKEGINGVDLIAYNQERNLEVSFVQMGSN